MSRRYHTWLAFAGLAAGCTLSSPAFSADSTLARAPTPSARVRLTKAIESTSTFAVPGTQPRQALARNDQGLVPAGDVVQDITLVLKRDDERDQAFRAYLSSLNNPSSRDFHHWLTADQIGDRFGPAAQDVKAVQQWLRKQGLTVSRVSRDRMSLTFSGSAAAVSKAFGTQLHHYTVDGEKHFGNSAPVRVPASLATLVQGVSLHNFFPKAQHTAIARTTFDRKHGKWSTAPADRPAFTVPPGTSDPVTTYDMVPADFNRIYNVDTLWQRSAPVRGEGQTVVLLGRSDIQPGDVARFRQAFLPANAKGTFQILHPSDTAGDTCDAPGRNGDEGEAALDAEWAGAAAPDANIVLATCGDSVSVLGATFGPLRAASLLLDGGLDGKGGLPPPIWNLSYAGCESADPSDAGTADYLWSTAAMEGVTVFVASGDGGSAQCDQGGFLAARSGAAVNGLAASPSAIAVGGTDFNDRGVQDTYWTQGNLPYFQSAIGYIPEMTWNNSCASEHLYTLLGYKDGITACNDSKGRGGDFLQLGGGGGGPSTLFAQPVAQVGIYGSTNHVSRTLPDISLFSANGIFGHALVFCMSDPDNNGTACDFDNPDAVFANSAGGTSFASPAMAGVQALINQASGGRNGNMLPALYDVAAKQFGTVGAPNTKTLTSCASGNGQGVGPECVFYNVTEGDIVQPCFAGTINCDSGKKLNNLFGTVLGGDVDTHALVPAWHANAGYSMATGLGSINAANLADAIAGRVGPSRRGYAAPSDFASLNNVFNNDGYSDFAYVDTANGELHSIAMKGAVSLYDQANPLDAGSNVVAFGDLVPSLDALGLTSGEAVIVAADRSVSVSMSGGDGTFGPFPLDQAAPATWVALGTGVNDASGVQKLVWFDTATSKLIWWSIDLAPTGGDATTVTAQVTMDGMAGFHPTLADANDDGYTDIVWTRDGDTATWLWIADQRGGFVTRNLGAHTASATLAGVGDVDGNGTTDLIWIDDANAQLGWWTLNGFQVTKKKTRAIPAGYTLAGIADYDGDGIVDLLWENANRRLFDWQGDGTGFTSSKVADAWGTPVTLPKGATAIVNRFQGSRRITP